ncbi:hypothetical protein EDB19DRAFT_1830584 [Suillus lakei]|nr:hypothetical protein EDB19DRAFT_1830584 [Suillus lakei]
MAAASTLARHQATNQKMFKRRRSSTSVTTKQGSLPLTVAREEALSTLSSTQLANYHKLAKGPAPGSAGLWKDRKETNPYPASQACWNTASSSTTATTAIFRVASIAMLTCGVDRNGLVRETKAPSRGGQNEIQAMRNCGCYLDQQFRIDSGWTYSKITSNLHTWFPKVFNYLDTNRIPDNVYESWNTQPIIAGSDSKRDCSDALLSDTDSLDNSVVDKSNNELASSLMELDLTDVEVKDSDPKGKMKARSLKRTNRMKRVLSPDQSPSDATRVVQKKLKKGSNSQGPSLTQPAQSSSLQTVSFHSQVRGAAAVLQLKNELSSPPEFVSVSEADVLWRNKTEDNDPFTPEHINPWDSHYIMTQNPTNFLV